MNKEQKNTIDTVVKWMEICEESGYSLPLNSIGFLIYSRKSSLLNRLLSGKKHYKFAPPKSYSYPNYRLLEKESHSGYMPVYTSAARKGYESLIIDQAIWFIIENLGDGEYIVSYNPAEGSKWRVRPLNFDETYRVIRDLPRLDKSHESIVAQIDIDKDKYNKIELVERGLNKLEE